MHKINFHTKLSKQLLLYMLALVGQTQSLKKALVYKLVTSNVGQIS